MTDFNRFRIVDREMNAYTAYFRTSGEAIDAAVRIARGIPPSLMSRRAARAAWTELKEDGYQVQEITNAY